MTIVDDQPPSAPTAAVPVELEDKVRAAVFWRTVFRWHFYAGVFVMPVLLTLAVTGLGILVKPTLERTFYGDRLYVERGAATVSYERQVATVEAAYPGATIRAVTPPPHPERSTQVDVTSAGDRDLSVYVDPYDASVLGAIENTYRLNNVLEKIHGTLWAGTVGDYFIELVAGWTLVMMATGVYLWWPRSKKDRLRKAFPLRLRTPGRRRLRDLHSTPAAIFASVVFFLVLTGLPWSGFWGGNWARLADATSSGYNTPDPPTSQQAASSVETQGLRVAWATDRQPVPLASTVEEAGDTGASSDDHYHVTPGTGRPAVPVPLSLERVTILGNEIGMRPGFSVGLPEGATGVYTISNSWPSESSEGRTVFVDQYSTNVLTDHGWQQYGLLAKATSFGIAGHMGREYGVVNAIVMGLTCLAIIGAIVTSPMMWWRRRGKGSTGFPRRQPDAPMMKGVLVIAVVHAVLFPLLGLSMVVVALVDRYAIRRIPALRSAFGS